MRQNKSYKLNPVESNLEFYVHYEGINRRWDEWVNFERIKKWDESLSKKEMTLESIVENDEHEGLDERSLAKHEELTKFKTIENIEIGKHRCET